MSTTYHTDISVGAAANAATFNSPLGQLDAAIALGGGGAGVSAGILKGWTEGGAYEMTAVTYDGTYPTVVASATVKWPDGSAGTFTTDTINTTWLAVDAFHITHTTSGKTVTQTAVTRNADGNITAKPALTVA